MVPLVGNLRQAKPCRHLIDRVLFRGNEQLAVVLFCLVQPALLQTDFAQHKGGSMQAIARDLERLKAFLPLQSQPSSLLRPTFLHLARDDGQNAGTPPEHRRFRREGERSPGKANRQGEVSMPASNLGMTGERFA